jgi:hypothetical protein
MKYGVDPEQPHSVLAGEQLRQLNAALRAKRIKAAAAPAPVSTEGSLAVQSGQLETEAPARADADP